jgi:LysM repeat protein
MDAFDMSPGKAEKNSTDAASRTAVKDLLNASWLYSDRKLTELQGALDLGFSILEFQTVDQVQPDGSVKQIRYAEAFETDKEGLLKLKDGINPEWGINNTNHTIEAGDTIESIAKKYNMSEKEIAEKNSLKKGSSLTVGETLVISTNKKFNEIKRRIASANKKLNGTMAKIDSPIGEKYLLYDVFTFSRKFGTGMFLSRYQSDMSKENRFGEVWDWDLDESNRGKYIQFLATTKNLITDYKNYWPIMTKEEKSQAYEVITEGMMLVMTGLLVTYLFGYSSGDEDRFAKMKMRQERYGVGGWLANHALYQLMMVQRENQSFIPIPGVGMDEWLDFTETSSIVVGPTLSLYSKIVTDLGLILTGNDKAVYKQEVGPYSWQKEGSYKIWNHIGQIFGLSGKNVIPPAGEWESGPIWAIKKAEIFENLR